MNPFTIAWRNVWRNRRRSLVTISAMSFALVMMILYSGLVEGYLRGMERKMLDLEIGDIQIHAGDYRKKPSLYTRIEDDERILNELHAAGLPASGRLLGAGLAAVGDASAGIAFRGVDPRRDSEVSAVSQHVTSGEWLDPDEPHGVVIGKRLAKMLDVELGGEMVVLSQAADGSMANDLYQVRGILKSIAAGVDQAGVYMTDAAFRELFVMPEGVHQIIVRRPASIPLETARARVDDIVGDLDVKTWRELVPTMASMLDSMEGSMMAMFVIVNLAIGIVILNAMLMAVFERIREFGVLKAIGVGPGSVFGLILLESSIQTAIATVVGTAAAVPGFWYLTTHGIDLSSMGDATIAGLAWDPIWKAVVSVKAFVNPILTMMVIVGIAVMYPALRAAFIRPVQAMRHR